MNNINLYMKFCETCKKYVNHLKNQFSQSQAVCKFFENVNPNHSARLENWKIVEK